MSESSPALGGDNPVDMAAEILMGGPAEEVKQEDEDVTVFSDESDVEESYSDDGGDASHDADPEDEPDQADDDDGLVALAHELGLDDDKLTLSEDGEIMVKLKVNGEEQVVDLKEAIAGTQYSKANEAKAREIADQRKSLEAERQQISEAFTQQYQQVQALGEMLQNKLMADYQSVDWDRLRVTDPGEYAAKQYEFQQKQQELHNAGQILGQRLAQAKDQQTEEESKQRQQILEMERAAMVEAVPDWGDTEKLKGDLSEIVEYARGLGFPDDELSGITFNRHVQVLRKAMLFDKGQTVANKKVKEAPKVQRASNGRFVSSSKKSKTSKLIERAKNAKGPNRRNAQHDAVAAILMGD